MGQDQWQHFSSGLQDYHSACLFSDNGKIWEWWALNVQCRLGQSDFRVRSNWIHIKLNQTHKSPNSNFFRNRVCQRIYSIPINTTKLGMILKRTIFLFNNSWGKQRTLKDKFKDLKVTQDISFCMWQFWLPTTKSHRVMGSCKMHCTNLHISSDQAYLLINPLSCLRSLSSSSCFFTSIPIILARFWGGT